MSDIDSVHLANSCTNERKESGSWKIKHVFMYFSGLFDYIYEKMKPLFFRSL